MKLPGAVEAAGLGSHVGGEDPAGISACASVSKCLHGSSWYTLKQIL